MLEVATHVYLPVAPDVLGGWLDALAGDDLVLRGLLAKERDGELAAAQALLEQARDDARAHGDPAGELACLVHLFSIGWSQDDLGLLAAAITRAIELGAEGYAPAGPIAAIGEAGLADFVGDAEGALAALEAAPIQPTDDWDAIRTWMRADLLEASGHPAAALDALDRGRRDAVGLIRDQLNGARIQALWSLGRIDEAIAVGEDALARAAATASARTAQRAHAMAARFSAHVGDVEQADEHLGMVDRYPPADRVIERRRAIARATRAVAAGDEASARAELAWVIDEADTVFLAARKTVLRVLPLVYVLLPELRPAIEALDVGPSIAVNRSLSRAFVAAREGDLDPLAALPTPPTGILRAALPVPWLVELAVALDELGRADGRRLLAELGAGTHAILARLAEGDPAARRLLAEVPRPPAHPVELRLLGAPELLRGGVAVTDAAWRRDRVRQLLAFLVLHGSASREVVADALWPDLDAEAAGNNLRGTLSHLLRLLQPDRQGREPSYFVSQVDRSLVLTGIDRLRVDVWEVEAQLDAAAAAERDGATRTALAAYREVVDLWRGPLGGDAPWGWLEGRAEQLAHRVLTATGRAAELLLASGELDQAEELAGRVLERDEWSERAYRVLASAQLARGERDAARRTLSRCRAALAELGAEPDPATEMVERRLT
jgi:DNA-binding SARP family transcriptional activator